jgi:hypothetical protein
VRDHHRKAVWTWAMLCRIINTAAAFSAGSVQFIVPSAPPEPNATFERPHPQL